MINYIIERPSEESILNVYLDAPYIRDLTVCHNGATLYVNIL